MTRWALDYIHKTRGLTFIEIGMRVSVDGKMGTVAGENASGNLDVFLDGDKHTSNVHPTWETIYYADDGTVLRSYVKAKDGPLPAVSP